LFWICSRDDELLTFPNGTIYDPIGDDLAISPRCRNAALVTSVATFFWCWPAVGKVRPFLGKDLAIGGHALASVWPLLASFGQFRLVARFQVVGSVFLLFWPVFAFYFFNHSSSSKAFAS
jgi:hypothetical protein